MLCLVGSVPSVPLFSGAVSSLDCAGSDSFSCNPGSVKLKTRSDGDWGSHFIECDQNKFVLH